MKLLLDTHTFIWWDSQPNRLSQTAFTMLQNSSNTLLLSVASIWEIQIKRQSGKLTLNQSLLEIIVQQQQNNKIEILPPIHKDPFDRLLIAQANVENAVLVSCDPIISQYPVNIAW